MHIDLAASIDRHIIFWHGYGFGLVLGSEGMINMDI